MNGENKTKEQLIARVNELRERLANQDAILEQKRQAEERVTHLNAVLKAIRNVSQLIVREKTRDRLIKGVCQNLTTTRSYYNCWIALFDEKGGFDTAAQSGVGVRFEQLLEIFRRGGQVTNAKRALKTPGVSFVEDPNKTCGDCPLADQYAGRAGLCVRLEHAGRIYGVLAVSLPCWAGEDKEEQSLLSEVADDIAFGLHTMELEKKKRASEEALRQSEEFQRSIIESSYDCIKVLDLEGNLLFMSKGGQKLMEISDITPYLNKSWVDFWKGEDYEAALQAIAKAKQGHIGEFTGYCPTEKGTSKWWEIVISPIFDKQGNVGRVLSISRDVTEQHQALDALKESEARMRSLLDASPLCIGLVQDRKIKWHNKTASRMLGYSPEEIKGKSTRILYESIEEFERVGAAINTLGPEKRTNDMESRWVRKDGSAFDCRIRHALLDPESEERVVLAIAEDITEQKNAEKEKENLLSQLNQAQKMEAIGVLAGGVAHDFNNLLTSIIGYADLALMDLREDTPVYHSVEQMRKAGQRAAALTRQLLAFSRKQTIQPEIVNLNDILMESEKMLRRLLGEDIDFLTVYEQEPWHVYMDPGQVDQVVMNLVVNARDAMPKGGKLTIETANVDLDEIYFQEHGVESAPGQYVMVAVTDTGTGMDRETQSRIFEPFFTTKELGRGTGLGLSTVFGIVKQNNGHIWVYSEPGKSTTFKVYLPRSEEQGDMVKKEELSLSKVQGNETILLVEDDQALRHLAKQMLETYGYTLLFARDGEEALKVENDHSDEIHLLLTDVVMPRMDGKDLAEKMQSKRPDMKVLFMSGYTDNAIAHHGVLDTSLSFIQKPFTSASLARKVREILDQ